MPGGAAGCGLCRQGECPWTAPHPCCGPGPARCRPAPPSWRQGLPDLPDHALPQALPSSSSGPPCPGMAPASPSAPGRQQTILMLKEQNRLLTQVRCGVRVGESAARQALSVPRLPGGDGQEREDHAAGAGEMCPHQAAVRGPRPQPAGRRASGLHLHLAGRRRDLSARSGAGPGRAPLDPHLSG